MFDLGFGATVSPWIWLTIAVVLWFVQARFVHRDYLLTPWSISAFVVGVNSFGGIPLLFQLEIFVIGGVSLHFAFGYVFRWIDQVSEDDE